MYYLATPIAKPEIKDWQTDKERLSVNSELANRLEKEGFEIYLPQRDCSQDLPGKEILERELEIIKNCEGIIVVLAETRGVYLEAGYAKALNKKVIALKVPDMREMSEWGYAFFDFVAKNEEELINYLKTI